MNLSDLTQFNPTPTSFPYDPQDIFWAFEGYPNALSNGYLLDMNILKKDLSLLKNAVKTYPQIHLASALHYMGDNNFTVIDDSQDIRVQSKFLLFIIKHSITRVNFGIQVRHWNYMRFRYPNCVFLQGRCEHADILVKQERDIVGIVTPIQLQEG